MWTCLTDRSWTPGSTLSRRFFLAYRCVTLILSFIPSILWMHWNLTENVQWYILPKIVISFSVQKKNRSISMVNASIFNYSEYWSTLDSGFSFFCSSLLLYHNCWCILTIPTVFRVPELSSLVLVYSKLGFVIITGIWQPLDILSAGRLFIIGLANLWSEDLHLHVPSKSVELEDAPVHFWEFKRVLTIILYAPSINPFTFFFFLFRF